MGKSRERKHGCSLFEFYFCNFSVSFKLCPNQKLKDKNRTLNSNILFSSK